MPEYRPEEIIEAHDRYLATRRRVEAGEIGWDAIAEHFTDDATFVDPAWGRIDGIDKIKRFLVDSMVGLEDWEFPHEWQAVDGSYLVTGWQNRLPGRRPDGSYYQAPGISRLQYAGGGKFCYEQDILNMVHVFELMKESGWQPKVELHLPPENPARLCSWER